MSIWLLLVYVLAMFSGIAALSAATPYAQFAAALALVALVVFVRGLLVEGIRRPVV